MTYRGTPQHKLGTRATSDWGQGSEQSRFAVGDVLYLPPDAPAVSENRCEAGLHRIESVFSIAEGPEFYYRLSPARIVNGNRISTDWNAVSDRLHTIPGKADYLKGAIVLWELVDKPA